MASQSRSSFVVRRSSFVGNAYLKGIGSRRCVPPRKHLLVGPGAAQRHQEVLAPPLTNHAVTAGLGTSALPNARWLGPQPDRNRVEVLTKPLSE